MTATTYIGQPVNRVDGRAKVTGGAKYAAEHNIPNLAYGFVVSSAIAKGRITSIDTDDALRLEGVLQVFTHENAPKLARSDRSYRDLLAPPDGSPFRPIYSDRILFSAQPIALVVAETFELARYAATLIRVAYERDPHTTDLRQKRKEGYAPKPGRLGYVVPPAKPRGNPERALAGAAVKHDAEYVVPVEHHNAMEPFATTAIYEDNDTITVYTKTQGVQNELEYLTNVFGFAKGEVRVLSPFVGGGFGSGLRPEYQLFLAVMAARELKRPVKVTLTRQQMFTFAHRPATLQRVALGASLDGTLEVIIHEALGETSQFEDYDENVVIWSGSLYRCENVGLDYKIARLDFNTPSDMRAPGATWGIYALESAMDELAYKLHMDPLELRLKNYSEKDQRENKPFSSKQLRECYRQGAERFGWAKRNHQPRSMREGNHLVGWGMATGIWEAGQVKGSAKAVLSPDGKLTVGSATADIGTGTYTIMTQIAADTLGLPIHDVTFKLGDSSLPEAFVEGGSLTAASTGTAVKAVCEEVREKLFKLAQKMDSRLGDAKLQDVTFADGQIRWGRDPSRAVSISEVMRHNEVNVIEAQSSTSPDKPKQAPYATYTHSAIFAEVKVDEDLGTIDVTRVVSAIAAGRIVNPKTARSQIIGGIVWGIGMALEEESMIDQDYGRFVNHDLAEYHVPVNADVRDIDVIFVEEHDSVVNPLGVKGVGEIGIVGVGAAIANAVFHATGKRIRDLPITLDKVL